LSTTAKFRAYGISKAITMINYDIIINGSAFDSLYVLKDNGMYRFDYDNVFSYNKNTFADEYKLGSIPENEQILLIDDKFVRTTNGIYKYGQLNENETQKYADVEKIYGYKKLDISKYINEIIYIDDASIVTIDGKVYR